MSTIEFLLNIIREDPKSFFIDLVMMVFGFLGFLSFYTIMVIFFG